MNWMYFITINTGFYFHVTASSCVYAANCICGFWHVNSFFQKKGGNSGSCSSNMCTKMRKRAVQSFSWDSTKSIRRDFDGFSNHTFRTCLHFYMCTLTVCVRASLWPTLNTLALVKQQRIWCFSSVSHSAGFQLSESPQNRAAGRGLSLTQATCKHYNWETNPNMLISNKCILRHACH